MKKRKKIYYRNNHSSNQYTSQNNESKSNDNSTKDNISNNNSNLSSKLCYFSSTDYIVLASTLAIALGEELSQNDLNILSTFFAVLSDELALITAVQNCESGNDNSVFVAPVPDVAVTSSKQKSNKNSKGYSKKIVKKKFKRK